MHSILGLSEKLLSLAILFQTIEMLQMRSAWMEGGVWRWSTLRKQFKSPILERLLNDQGFQILLILRLIAAARVILFPSGWLDGVLFLSTWLISIRWRGIFNGGSDSMTALVAFSLWIARCFSGNELIVKICFAYIAIQLTLSYLMASLVKVRNPEWRNGTALPVFINTPRYDSPPNWFRTILSNPNSAKFVSYGVILFQLSFPLAWLHPNICLGYIGVSMVFHLLNFWIFGLNRFVFAWAAAYPALYFWSLRL